MRGGVCGPSPWKLFFHLVFNLFVQIMYVLLSSFFFVLSHVFLHKHTYTVE